MKQTLNIDQSINQSIKNQSKIITKIDRKSIKKSSKNRSKSHSKNVSHLGSIFGPFGEPFWLQVGRFWDHFGAQNPPKRGEGVWRFPSCEHFGCYKAIFRSQRRIWEPSWRHFGPNLGGPGAIWVVFWLQLGSPDPQMGAK